MVRIRGVVKVKTVRPKWDRREVETDLRPDLAPFKAVQIGVNKFTATP